MTTFKQFMNEIKAEAIAEGPEAVDELSAWKEHFRKENERLQDTYWEKLIWWHSIVFALWTLAFGLFFSH